MRPATKIVYVPNSYESEPSGALTDEDLCDIAAIVAEAFEPIGACLDRIESCLARIEAVVGKI